MADDMFISSSSSSSQDVIDINNIGVRKTHASHNTNIASPYIGQIFSTLKEAEDFYRAYARNTGFEIKIGASHKYARSNNLSNRLYTCKKARKPIGKKCHNVDQVDDNKEKRKRDSIGRTMCKARMFVVHLKNEDKWKVSKIELNHNHDLITPSKVNLIETQRNITPVARALIQTLNSAGVGTSKIMGVFSEVGGGLDKVGFSDTDVRNVVRDLRRDTIDANDAQAALQYLKKVSVENPLFFYDIKRDDDNRIASILWIDYRSIIAYKNFGDVVTFDTTYRTNKYSMPFVPFTGVNHHYNSILFGFALIKDETEDTFAWVFKTWLEAMNNKAPVTIITDQDKAMSNAIARILPNTHHALCTWHISNKFPEKLHTLYEEYPTFKDDFNFCIYKSLTIEEFEERWEKLMIEYELHEHEWLQSLYAVKHKWVNAYSKKFFAAGMTTTSRSEGMNSLFDEYVNPTTSIKEFIVNSQKAIEKQLIFERKADYATCHRTRSMTLESPLEKHAARVYTKEMFRRFQVEILKSHKFIMQKIQHLTAPDTKSYAVYKSTNNEDSTRYFTVVNNVQTGDITCTCQKFEHVGILCRHILRHMFAKSTDQIPAKYIISRWCRDGNKVNAEVPKILIETSNYEESQTMRYNYLVKMLLRLASTGSCSIKGFQHVVQMCIDNQSIVEQFDPDDNNADKVSEIQSEEDEPDEDEALLDPICSQTKGRKKAKRIKSAIEEAASSRPLRKCAICGIMTNHDKRNHYKVLGQKNKKN